ncbi:MAG: DpnI domain-containing protein [Candidatus Hadarchaeum sp.]|uniref:DpnI domain-containing protein n=1 Tax=Candidatus Hadarchaeum sp. TaxID=2883567 RepID=UPI00316F7807
MNLELRIDLAKGYKSPSQQAKVLTETWASENLYCLACSTDNLQPTSSGKKVIDFVCPECEESYQLKSQSHPFGYRVTNSAYEPKIKAIYAGTIPNFLFLHYNPKAMVVSNLFAVPKHFISESIIEKRKPLSEKARRHGWIGSNILLGNLPLDARIPIIENGIEMPQKIVRENWKRFTFLREQSVHSRGWLSDVLASIRQLDREIFTLADIYEFEEKLAKLHPANKNIRPKIRQQLQVLRDHGIIEFLGKGKYRIKKS